MEESILKFYLQSFALLVELVACSRLSFADSVHELGYIIILMDLLIVYKVDIDNDRRLYLLFHFSLILHFYYLIILFNNGLTLGLLLM